MTGVDASSNQRAQTDCHFRPIGYLFCALALSLSALLTPAVVAANTNEPPSSQSFENLRKQVALYHVEAKHQAAIEAVRAHLDRLTNAEGREAAELLLMLGDAQMKAGQPKLAFASSEKAWKLRERLFGPTDARTLDALTENLEACALVGSVKSCEAQAGEAVKQYEALNVPNAPGLAAMLRSQALLVSYSGRNAQAILILDRAMAIWQESGALYLQNIHDALSSKAILLLNLGRYRQALASVEELLPRQRELLGERAPHVLTSLHLRATVLSRMGELDRAMEAAAETLRLRSEALGDEHQDTITTRQLLGTIQLKVGRVSDAASSLATTAALLERIQGADNSEAITARQLQGVALRQGGLYQESVNVLTQVIEDHRRVFGETHPEHGGYLAALAISLQAVGDTAGAISVMDRAVALGISVRGLTHPAILVRRLSALSMYESAGLATNADDVKPIIDALTQRFGPEHPDTLAARHLYAVILGHGGIVSEALDVMRPVAAARQRLLGASHVDSMRSQAALGYLLIKAQQPQEALATLDALLPQVRTLRRSVALFGPAAQRQVIAQFQPYLAERVALLARSGRLEDAFLAMEDFKARTLLEQMARQSAFAGVGLPAAVTERLQKLSSRHVAFESASGAEPRAEPRNALLQSLQNTHVELEAALNDASKLSPQFASLLDAPAPTISNLGLLDKQTALVHYLRGADDNLYALVASLEPGGGRKLRWFDLGEQRGLSGNIEALRAWTGGYGQRFPTDELGQRVRFYRVDAGRIPRWYSTSEANFCQTAVIRTNCIPSDALEVSGDSELDALRKHLGGRLLAPLLPALSGAQKVLISPDGALGVLPWDTLVVQREFVHRQWEISVTPSLAVFQITTQRHQTRQPRALLAFAASEGRVVNGERWPTLPYAEREANAAVALFRGQGSLAFVGKKASKSNLRQLADTGELGHFRQVLIAAHGRFDSRRPLSTAILFADDETARSDGLMTVSDWIGVKLNSDLVVLSACDTARGQLVAGEGLIGFGYALNVAGNRNLLATLWAVSDRASSDFVLEFLRNTKRGLSHASALNKTKRLFSQHPDPRRRSPRVWGGFVLLGQ